MSQSGANPVALRLPLGLGDLRLYLVTSAMVLGNLLLPYAVHRIPDGGRMLLPIFFFTLIAGWRFGVAAGLLTGLLSPLANHLLSGMPPLPAPPSILVQSALLGLLAATFAAGGRKPSLRILTLVVLLHQALILTPLWLSTGPGPALAALELRLPGLLLQVLGGFALLWFLGRHLPPSERPARDR